MRGHRKQCWYVGRLNLPSTEYYTAFMVRFHQIMTVCVYIWVIKASLKLQVQISPQMRFLPAARLRSTLYQRINSCCCSAPEMIVSWRKAESNQVAFVLESPVPANVAQQWQLRGVAVGRAGRLQLVVCRDSRCLYLQTALGRWGVCSWNKRGISSSLYAENSFMFNMMNNYHDNSTCCSS